MRLLKLLMPVLLAVACNSKVEKNVQSTSVKFGEFQVEVVETGEIQATRAVNISSPAMDWRFGQLKILKIIEDGTEVSKGDTVIQFDPSEVQKANLDATAELQIAKAELDKLTAEQESRLEELEANYKISEISYEIAQINLEQADFEAEITKKEIQLGLEKAKIDLDKAKEQIENQKKIDVEEQTQAKLKIKQLEARLEEGQTTLKNLTVVSPAPGIAVIRRNWSSGAKWQVGDQPWSGTPLIDLPDLSEIKVQVEINEVDIAKIKMGAISQIKLDAFSDTMFSGKIISIANLAKYKNQDKSKIKVFPVEILIDGSSKKLLPGMSVSSKIIVNKIKDKLFIPLEAVQKEEGKEYVYVKTASGFVKKEIETGISNNDYITINKGLKKGDKVALSAPYETEDKKDQNAGMKIN